jgi:plastocyanin
MRALLAVVAIAGTAHAAPGGTVTGTVRVTESDGKAAPGADVIVYIVGFDEPPGKQVAQIQQKGRRFVPDLVAVTLGETVEFPNGDPFLHNVFSQSPTRKFDLGSFKRGETKSRQFTSLGSVDVYCNIHPEMAATILVLPNRKHTHARADGTFQIDGVLPGTWKVLAYTRRAVRPASAQFTVTAGGTATVELVLLRGGEAPHTNKYGEKYRPESPGTYR